jgi:hypothetical protein
MFKNSVHILVEKIYKMGCLEGSGLPILYIGCTVPKGVSSHLIMSRPIPVYN